MNRGAHPDTERALSAALHLLRSRDRFEAEIRQECLKTGCEEEAVEQVIQDLKDKRMLADTRVAADLALKLSYKKMLSAERIRAHLALRGAVPEAIEYALAKLPPDKEVAARLLRSTKGETPKRLRKLSTNGFDQDTIEALID